MYIVGWSNPLGKPQLDAVELNETSNYIVSVLVNVSWSPPKYLGGLNTSDIYYQLTTNGHSINTTDTYSLLLCERLRIEPKYLDITIAIHYNRSTANTSYIPHKMLVKQQYNNLICSAVGEQVATLYNYLATYVCNLFAYCIATGYIFILSLHHYTIAIT